MVLHLRARRSQATSHPLAYMPRNSIDPKHARSALFAIDPGLPREEWHCIGRAAIAAGLTVDDLVEWSSPAPNFKSEADVRAAFRTIRPNGGTGIGTLWKAAIDSGWRPPLDDAPQQPSRDVAASESRPRKPKQPKPGMSAVEVWNRCEAANDAHGYVEAKKGLPVGLRVVPIGDPLRVGADRKLSHF